MESTNISIVNGVNLTDGNFTNYSNNEPASAAVLRVVVPIVFFILMLVGVVGNGLLIYTVFANKCMRNTPNILIVSLSIGDMVLLLMSAPFSSMYFTLSEYPFGVVVCKGNEYLQTLCVGVSVFTLTALSGDRFFAIVFPMSKHKGKPRLKIGITVASIWILSALFAIPEAVNMNIVVFEGKKYCFDDQVFMRVFTMVKFIVLFVVPLLIIAFFYCMMAIILVTSSRRIPCETSTGSVVSRQQKKQMEARVKVAKVVLSFVFLFILCWLPRYVFLLWFHWSGDDAEVTVFWVIFKVIGFCLMYVYSSINPYALYFLSSQFRRYYNKYLFRCCPKSYRPIQPESASAMLYNGTIRRGSTSMTIIKAHSEKENF